MYPSEAYTADSVPGRERTALEIPVITIKNITLIIDKQQVMTARENYPKKVLNGKP
jgi:hypothetical protein